MDTVFKALGRQGKRQIDLAKHCGVSKAAVSNWKKGGGVTAAHAAAIIAFFRGDITYNDIYGGKRKRAVCE